MARSPVSPVSPSGGDRAGHLQRGGYCVLLQSGGHGTACVRVRVGQSGITRIRIESNRWGRSLIFCLMISCRSWHLELETNASAELTLLFGQRNPLRTTAKKPLERERKKKNVTVHDSTRLLPLNYGRILRTGEGNALPLQARS